MSVEIPSRNDSSQQLIISNITIYFNILMAAKLMFISLVLEPLLLQRARQDGRLNQIRRADIILQAMEKKLAEERRNSCATARQKLVI